MSTGWPGFQFWLCGADRAGWSSKHGALAIGSIVDQASNKTGRAPRSVEVSWPSSVFNS